jgi:membrane protein DedA with SNARE-associated domain
MIKWIVLAAAVGVGIAFAAGSYAGSKATMKVLDAVTERLKMENLRKERERDAG